MGDDYFYRLGDHSRAFACFCRSQKKEIKESGGGKF